MNKRQRGRNRRQPNNNPNRSMDSNGPDVKVRGSATTIYEKYVTLARDARSAGSRVKAENYLQHAEHYLRIIQDQKQKAQAIADKNAEKQTNRQKHQNQNQNKNQNQAQNQNNDEQADDGATQNSDQNQQNAKNNRRPNHNNSDQNTENNAGNSETDVVAVDEAEPAPKKKTRRRKKPKAETVQNEGDATDTGEPSASSDDADLADVSAA